MDVWMAILAGLALLVALDLVALRWGASSLEGFEDVEWRRRQQWRSWHRS